MGGYDTGKQDRSILDLLTFDLTSFFYGNYTEVDSDETEGMFMITYERKLPWIELNIFDTVQFRVFFDKNNFTGSNPVNVKLLAVEKEASLEQMKYVVNQVAEIYGTDNAQKSFWTKQDDKEIYSGDFSRIWTIEKGESFVSLFNHEDEKFVLNILFFNNLIKHTGKYLNIRQ